MTTAYLFTLIPAVAGLVLAAAIVYGISSIVNDCVKTRCAA